MIHKVKKAATITRQNVTLYGVISAWISDRGTSVPATPNSLAIRIWKYSLINIWQWPNKSLHNRNTDYIHFIYFLLIYLSCLLFQQINVTNVYVTILMSYVRNIKNIIKICCMYVIFVSKQSKIILTTRYSVFGDVLAIRFYFLTTLWQFRKTSNKLLIV